LHGPWHFRRPCHLFNVGHLFLFVFVLIISVFFWKFFAVGLAGAVPIVFLVVEEVGVGVSACHLEDIVIALLEKAVKVRQRVATEAFLQRH
jgi:hypothetical protein